MEMVRDTDPEFLFGDDDSDFVKYKCNSLAVNHIQWYQPDSLDDDCGVMGPGEDLIHVLFTDVEIYTPKSILGEGTTDCVLSALACSSAMENATCRHLDPGSQATTIPYKHLISGYQVYSKEFPCPVRLVSADDKPQFPLGEGTVRIPPLSAPGYVDLRAFHTPGIPLFIVLPRPVQEHIGFDKRSGYLLKTNFVDNTFMFTAKDKSTDSHPVVIPGDVVGSLNYT